MILRPPIPTLFPYTTLFRSGLGRRDELPPQDLFVDFTTDEAVIAAVDPEVLGYVQQKNVDNMVQEAVRLATVDPGRRSEEHTSELQSRLHLVCRLLLEKKKK